MALVKAVTGSIGYCPLKNKQTNKQKQKILPRELPRTSACYGVLVRDGIGVGREQAEGSVKRGGIEKCIVDYRHAAVDVL